MKFYFLSPIGASSPGLFETFPKTFIEQGHEIVDDIRKADIVFLDLYSKRGTYYVDDMSVIQWSKLPVCVFDATDYGGMSTEISAIEEAKQFKHPIIYDGKVTASYMLADFLSKNKVVYFMRKMDATKEFPSWVYPYELCIYPDHDFPIATKEELNNRPFDICFIGNTSPQRKSVTHELSNHFKCDFILGQQRIPHDQWLDRHRQAKLYLTSDGGGFGDERPYQLFSIAAQLRQKNNQKLVYPFSDCQNCLMVSENPTTEEIETIKTVLNDPEYLFEIYKDGYEFMKEFYSQETRANYILQTLKKEGIL